MNANDIDAAPEGPLPRTAVVEAVSRVVAAFATRADTTQDEIVSLAQRLSDVFGSLSTAPVARPAGVAAQDRTTLPTADSPAPAVPLDQAVTGDKVYCLCCGRGFTMLKRHLKAEHGLTEEEYRTLFGLPEDMPLVAPNYSERKAAYAKRVGLGKYQRDQADPSVSGAD